MQFKCSTLNTNAAISNTKYQSFFDFGLKSGSYFVPFGTCHFLFLLAGFTECEGGLKSCLVPLKYIGSLLGRRAGEKWRIKQKNLSGLVDQMRTQSSGMITEAEGWNWPLKIVLAAHVVHVRKKHLSAKLAQCERHLTTVTERWRVPQQARSHFDPFTA